MRDSNLKNNLSKRIKSLIYACIIGLAIVGFFTGINDGVPKIDSVAVANSMLKRNIKRHEKKRSRTDKILAVRYSEMRRSERGPTSQWVQTLKKIPQPEFNLFDKFKPSEKEKLKSSSIRASRRAFNGAPPIVPHPVEGTSDSACYACHGQGLTIGKKRANRMSHGFFANCLQCHAVPAPKIFNSLDGSVENSFSGLAAPLKGERAFPGAPPTIPHSTWMRDRCLSCHGKEAGWAGLESTHPWRTNCLQCHAPSAKLNQSLNSDHVPFLSPIKIKQK